MDVEDEIMFEDYFTRRTYPVAATQLTYDNIEAVADWMREQGGGLAGMRVTSMGPLARRGIRFGTLGGVVSAVVGDWIIHGVLGEFTRCEQEAFARRYAPVPPPEPDGSEPNSSLAPRACWWPSASQ